MVRDLAFDAWFRSTYGRTVDRLQRLVGERPAAEDVVAEAFARALIRWPELEAADYRDAWVTRVAVNLGLDSLRRRHPADIAEPASDSEAATLRLVVRQSLRSLPRKQREAIALRYLIGMDADEVARTLNVSLNTVKTHLRRGLARLRADPNLAMHLEGFDVV